MIIHAEANDFCPDNCPNFKLDVEIEIINGEIQRNTFICAHRNICKMAYDTALNDKIKELKEND